MEARASPAFLAVEARPLQPILPAVAPSSPKSGIPIDWKCRRRQRGNNIAGENLFGFKQLEWSEWRDSNPRPLVPQKRNRSSQTVSH